MWLAHAATLRKLMGFYTDMADRSTKNHGDALPESFGSHVLDRYATTENIMNIATSVLQASSFATCVQNVFGTIHLLDHV